MTKKCWSILAVVVLCFFVSNCSFSTSSKHSSKSSSSSCRSSSKQGAESANKTSASYQEEVSALAILYVGSMGSTQDFQRELGKVASDHGIIDWQNTESTFKAIGIGLKRAKIPVYNINTLPFLDGLWNSPFYPQIKAAYQ